jgi:hypothetical protein
MVVDAGICEPVSQTKTAPPGPGTQNIQKSAGKFFVLIFLSRILIDQAIDIASLFLQIPGGPELGIFSVFWTKSREFEF